MGLIKSTKSSVVHSRHIPALICVEIINSNFMQQQIM